MDGQREAGKSEMSCSRKEKTDEHLKLLTMQKHY